MKILKSAHQLAIWAIFHSMHMNGQLVQWTNAKNLANRYLVLKLFFNSYGKFYKAQSSRIWAVVNGITSSQMK